MTAPSLESILQEVLSPEDLVVRRSSGKIDRLRELRFGCAIMAGRVDLLCASLSEPRDDYYDGVSELPNDEDQGSDDRLVTMLDLAFRFEHHEFALQLARLGSEFRKPICSDVRQDLNLILDMISVSPDRDSLVRSIKLFSHDELYTSGSLVDVALDCGEWAIARQLASFGIMSKSPSGSKLFHCLAFASHELFHNIVCAAIDVGRSLGSILGFPAAMDLANPRVLRMNLLDLAVLHGHHGTVGVLQNAGIRHLLEFESLDTMTVRAWIHAFEESNHYYYWCARRDISQERGIAFADILKAVRETHSFTVQMYRLACLQMSRWWARHDNIVIGNTRLIGVIVSFMVAPLKHFKTPRCRALARHDFDGRAYGVDYMDLSKGDVLDSSFVLESGWAFGFKVQDGCCESCGWFPPAFVENVASYSDTLVEDLTEDVSPTTDQVSPTGEPSASQIYGDQTERPDRETAPDEHPRQDLNAEVETTPEELEAKEEATVLEESKKDAQLQEDAWLMEAIVASKSEAPPLSGDDVVLLRLTHCSAQIKQQLLSSPEVELYVQRMADAGCDLSPSWAHGAMILVPTTEDQVIESGLALRPHNILALRSDQDAITRALAHLPKRKRPQLKAETLLDTSNEQANVDKCDVCHQQFPEDEGVSSQMPVSEFGNHDFATMQENQRDEPTSDSNQQAFACSCQIRIEVERTFLRARLTVGDSEVSSLVASAPCGASESPQPANPRRSTADPLF